MSREYQYISVTGSGRTTTNGTFYINPNSTAIAASSTTYFSYLAAPATTLATGAATNAYTAYIAGAPTISGGGTLTNTYALYVAAGLTSLLGGLTLTGATSISSITGSSPIDYSGSTGTFKTSTGAITLGGSGASNVTTIPSTLNSTTTSTGALVVSGGVGINNDLRVGGTIFGALSGTISLAIVQVTSDGTFGAPAYSWFSDQTTGLYRIGASNIGISLGGTKYVDLAITSSTFSNTLVTTKIGNTTAGSATFYVNPSSTAVAASSTTYFSYLTAPATTLATGAATNAYTMYIAGAPTISGGGTLTNPYALYVAAGNTSLLGGLTLTGATSISSITGSGNIDFSGSSGTFTTTTGAVNINGPMYMAQTTYTTSSSLPTASGGTLNILNSSSTFTITLPAPVNGLNYYLINIGTAAVTIQTANTSAQYFDGNSLYSTITMNQYDHMHIVCYGTNWFTF